MIAVDAANVKLSGLLKDSSIELSLEGKNKLEVLGELTGLICRTGKFRNKKVLTDALAEREKLGSTAIGNGVAVPHAKIDGIKQTMLAFGRSEAGVDFNALDGEKTHLFFMLISPKEDIGAHLKILAKISHLIKDKFTLSLLRKAANKEDILKIISGIEKHT